MKVILAGFNVDLDVLKELGGGKIKTNVTPETLSASYARISRDPRPVNELRKIAVEEVEKARSSNQRIIFDMGHQSIAEHAVFNLDIINISRLAVEYLESARLCSYTEKSQRYITLTDDFLIPQEIKDLDMEREFVEMIRQQNALYHKLYERLKEYVYSKYPKLAREPKKHSLLDGWAKEDARYVTSLSTYAQLGMTANARNIERMLRRFAANPLSEIRELGQNIYNQIYQYAPSLIRYCESTPYELETYSAVRDFLREKEVIRKVKGVAEDVKVVSYTQEGDDIVLAGLLCKVDGMNFPNAIELVRQFSFKEKMELVKRLLRYMQFYDVAPREFELAEVTYQIILSASCFAQLKRHRMATLIVGDYDPALGVTVPDSIKEVGMEDEFIKIINDTEDLYYKVKSKNSIASAYILTNAHRRRVIFKCNIRELYHIARLRGDQHAQWDIREKATKMIDLAKKYFPLITILACGKDQYLEVYKSVYPT